MERHLRHEPPTGRDRVIPRTPTVGARGYEAIDDPDELRIVLRELHRVRSWLGQFADLAAELPGVELESVRAAKANAAMVTLLVERAETRLRRLVGPASAEVVVLDPQHRQVADALGGFSFLPMVSAPTVRAPGLSSATLTLDPGEAFIPHVYPDCDVIVIVVCGVADLYWWDDSGVLHSVSHEPDQHAFIRRGTRHCAVNSGSERMVAVQVQATAKVTAGMTLLPDLAAELPTVGWVDSADAVAAG